MSGLRAMPSAAVAECLQALDAGVSSTDCLAARPEYAAELAGIFELRRLLGLRRAPEPQPAAFAAGRDMLLASLSRAPSATPARRSWSDSARELLATGWLRPPIARIVAASLLVFALAGGALGASAAAGVDQARSALSALHIVQSAPAPTTVPQTPLQDGSGASDSGGSSGNGSSNGGHGKSDTTAPGAAPSHEGTAATCGSPSSSSNGNQAAENEDRGSGDPDCPNDASVPPASEPAPTLEHQENDGSSQEHGDGEGNGDSGSQGNAEGGSGDLHSGDSHTPEPGDGEQTDNSGHGDGD